MAQTTDYLVLTNEAKQVLSSSSLAIAVAQAGTTTLLELDVRQFDRFYMHFDVTSQALGAFQVQTSPHMSAGYDTLYSAAGDFTSPRGLLVGASGDLTTVASGASGWFILDIRAVQRIKVVASSGNVAGSTVAAYAGAR